MHFVTALELMRYALRGGSADAGLTQPHTILAPLQQNHLCSGVITKQGTSPSASEPWDSLQGTMRTGKWQAVPNTYFAQT